MWLFLVFPSLGPVLNQYLIFIISFLFITLSQIVDIFEIQEFSKIKKMEIICAGYPKVDVCVLDAFVLQYYLDRK